jgi:hypothetical protein
MTRFRQVLIAFAIAVVLAIPTAGVASADPGDPGGTTFSSTSTTTSTGPGRGYAYGRSDTTTTTMSTDPGDPGGTTY